MLVSHREISVVAEENGCKSTEPGEAPGPGHTNQKAWPAEPAHPIRGRSAVGKSGRSRLGLAGRRNEGFVTQHGATNQPMEVPTTFGIFLVFSKRKGSLSVFGSWQVSVWS